MHKGLIFSIFLASETFKNILPKETLLDTAILLISIFFVEIGLLC